MSITLTSADLVERLAELQAERAAASLCGLVNEPRYMEDLEDEIQTCTAAYVGASVTEIAVLRAALDGKLQG